MSSTDWTRANTARMSRAGRARQTDSINVGQYERLASAVSGPLVALYGVSRGSAAGLGLALIGGALFYRGMTGHCHVYQALGVSTAEAQGGPLHVEKSITINRPAEELYRFWRNFENLPRFMKHLEAVRNTGDRTSHWVARAPAGTTVEWDAELTEDQPNQLIAWRSLPHADVDNAGTVRFESAGSGRGTVVRVVLDYNPPAGALGAAVAKLFAEEPSQQIEGDLRRFRNIMEAGEIPTTEGQPAGQRSALGAMFKPEQKPRQVDSQLYGQNKQPRRSIVQEASEESFPASDAPGWIGSRFGDSEREVGR